jgi:hypothetical protein
MGMFIAGLITGLILGFIGLIGFALIAYDRRMFEQGEDEHD